MVEALRERGADDVVVFGGGIIPDEDVEALRSAGIEAVFTPGARLDEIAAWVEEHLTGRS